MAHIELELAVREAWGVVHVVGIDEAGRGAIAGPVVAGAVILPLDDPEKMAQLAQVNDSKQLSAKRREWFYGLIVSHAIAWGAGVSSAQEVDGLGILPANGKAMGEAVRGLTPAGEFLLIDGRMKLRQLNIPQRSVVRGDSISLSIAAASIIAKVTRDRLMVELGVRYPQYGFAQHKGYCTRPHEAALKQFGPCPDHRYTFAPIRQPML